jgi:hypothetical protein
MPLSNATCEGTAVKTALTRCLLLLLLALCLPGQGLAQRQGHFMAKRGGGEPTSLAYGAGFHARQMLQAERQTPRQTQQEGPRIPPPDTGLSTAPGPLTKPPGACAQAVPLAQGAKQAPSHEPEPPAASNRHDACAVTKP